MSISSRSSDFELTSSVRLAPAFDDHTRHHMEIPNVTIHSPATLTRRSVARPTFRILALGVTASVGLVSFVGTAANADTDPAFFAVQNLPASAAVTGSATGSEVHLLRSQVKAVAADGTAQVLNANLTGTTFGTVAVDSETGVAHILAPQPAGTKFYAGNGEIVALTGDTFKLIDAGTAVTTTLAKIPAASPSLTRTVTAVAAVADGAIVATADVTATGTTGSVQDAHLWKLTTAGAEQLASFATQHVGAVVADADGVDALLVSLADDSLSHLHIASGGGQATNPVGVTLPANTISVDLGYAADGTDLLPVLSVTHAHGVTVSTLAGHVLDQFPTGSRIFMSAHDVLDPSSVANKLTKVSVLTGVPQGPLANGKRVTPVAGTTAANDVLRTTAPSLLTMRQGSRVKVVRSGVPVTLTKNTTFTVTSAATEYAAASAPVTKSVAVAHRVSLKSLDKKHHRAVVSTSAHRISVQVRAKGKWRTVRTVVANARQLAGFGVPTGTVRVVAVKDTANAAAVLGIKGR